MLKRIIGSNYKLNVGVFKNLCEKEIFLAGNWWFYKRFYDRLFRTACLSGSNEKN